jgi:hypothetical protein
MFARDAGGVSIRVAVDGDVVHGSSESGLPTASGTVRRFRPPHRDQSRPLVRLKRPPTSWTGATQATTPLPATGGNGHRDASTVRSSLSCRRMDAWGDVCVYRDVCFKFPLGARDRSRPDGGMRFFWGPEGNTAGYRALFPVSDVQTGFVAPRTPRVGARNCR